MSLDPDLLKQLIETFKPELEDQLQIITKNLLWLEKNTPDNADYASTIEEIFRAAHNIKGTSRSLGIKDVGEIAHRIESIFSEIQKNKRSFSVDIVDVCLEAIDNMRLAFQGFLAKEPPKFDLEIFLQRLEATSTTTPAAMPAKPNPKPIVKKEPEITATEIESDETIRVSIRQIDKVAELMEEMQVNKIGFEDHYAEFVKISNQAKKFENYWKPILDFIHTNSLVNESIQQLYYPSSDTFSELRDAILNLNKNMRNQVNQMSILSQSLQEEIRLLRLVPAESLLQNIPRFIRDIAHDLNKKVEVTIKGDDVKMDKMVLEGLKDPLIHLIRNALDHGIELSDERLRQGKPEVANIKIELTEEGNQIVLEVTDDGAGIDPKKILNTAIQKNILTVNEITNLSENEVLDLIFRPSFSTKEIITDVSGRGVGLDIVRSNLTALKGSVTVSSILGQGTRFTLRVPLTLASERGLVIQSSGQIFVIPTANIERILTISTKEISQVEASQVILVDDISVPLFSFSDVLGMPRQEMLANHKIPVVVIKKGLQILAFWMEEILGERDIVVKPLQPPLNNTPCIAGGTLSGESQVIVVVNTTDLMNQALEVQGHPLTLQTQKIKVSETPHILVVDDSITTRTLEKNILESKNYRVTVAANGKEAWGLLQKHKFSLMVTDVNMPVMDGLTLTQHVKQSETLHDLPVIIVTSLGSENEKKRGVEVGADAYIVKNEFESQALLEIINQLV